MFVDRYNRVKWFNVILAKVGVFGSLFLAVHYSAYNHTLVKNIENTILHGPRQAAEGFYRGDAEVVTVYNKQGDMERYFMFLPSQQGYALGEDGLAKDPNLLVQGLENRIEKLSEEEAKSLAEKITGINQELYKKRNHFYQNY